MATPAAAKLGPVAGTGVIVASAALPTFAVDNRVSELFCCQEREKRSRSNDEPRRKGNNRGKATLSGPCPKTVDRWSGSANNILDPTVGHYVTINLGNRVAQIRKSKIFALL